MGKFKLDKPGITIDGADFSCHANNVTISASKAELDGTTFCGQDTVPGLEESSISIGLIQDFDAAAVDATLWPLFASGDSFTVTVRPVKASAVSATNPEYSGSVRLLSYEPLSGGPGDLVDISLELKIIGSLERSVTP